ncbi:DUF2628 domain-containing protein [Snodgrassella alvi]|jgi:hypothetical protein|uniref:DUF2628 domain-containing protein n=1 Tax=Snodgrassella alvi TaxID=1196083 RepID=UPI000C1DDD0D|nr:DUF2628 domain-containing protein [Snodgrassella alvi]PIT49534.1 hypothetical protein BHC51_03520 [Snodgrassella alvi]
MDNGTEKNFDFANWGLSKAWQFRFEFFEENGLPKLKSTAQYKENFKALSVGRRITLNCNFWAAFFGPFYFLFLGMWRKAITLVLFLFTIKLVLVISGVNNNITSCAYAALSMTIANPAYYLHRVKKSKSFNIFEGLF